MAGNSDRSNPGIGDNVDVAEVLDELKELEQEVSRADDREQIRQVRKLLERVPGTKQIDKYTTRDMGESFIGGLVFSLPLLVEDGVFDIAAWFAESTVGPIPVFFSINVFLIITITAGLLYVIDIREVIISRPILGIIPRRLIGILTISFLCAFGMMYLWGRLHEGDPTALESLARATVIWASAALGAVLADILPGESKGQDISEFLPEGST